MFPVVCSDSGLWTEGLSCPFHTFCLVKLQHLLENCDIRVSGSPPWALETGGLAPVSGALVENSPWLPAAGGSHRMVLLGLSQAAVLQLCGNPPWVPARTVRGLLAVHSIDSFLQSWGWPLGKHSAVYNSAYVHCGWGLWVSQKGCALRLCPKRQAESQLYGNGRKGGGGSLLPDLMLKIQEARLLSNPLNPDLTRSLRSDTEARLRPPGPASLALCQPALRRHKSAERAKSIFLWQSFLPFSGEAPKSKGALRAGWWQHLWEKATAFCVSDISVLSRIAQATNIWSWCLLPSGFSGEPRVGSKVQFSHL